MTRGVRATLALLRICLGLLLLWAFADKLFGFGFATQPGAAWINGVSPTVGFLSHASRGPLVNVYHALAGQPVVDWLFMLGLLGIGLGLTLGLASCLTTGAGITLFALMYSAVLPPIQNPLIDEHVIFSLLLVLLLLTRADETWGLGRWWRRTLGRGFNRRVGDADGAVRAK